MGVGILFLFPASPVLANTQLLCELMAETNWPAVLVESRRVLQTDPADETARLGEALALPAGAADTTLRDLADSARSPDIRARAAYDLGARAQASGDASNAWRYLRIAFLAGGPEEITLKSAWRMSRLRTPPSVAYDAVLAGQLRTVMACVGRLTRRACETENRAIRPRRSLFSLPAQGIVAFYRTAIAPAIGSRCSLTPSCSAYFGEAGRKHGLMAFPMIADRLVREPSTVAAGAHPVRDGQRTRCADPVAAHDYWW